MVAHTSTVRTSAGTAWAGSTVLAAGADLPAVCLPLVVTLSTVPTIAASATSVAAPPTRVARLLDTLRP